MRLIPYYGSKTRIAATYEAPRYGVLIEPFAGAAAYSLRYPHLEVRLYDINPVIVGVWNWIIRATPKDIDQIPDDPPAEVQSLQVPQELGWLLGFWANPGSVAPCNQVTEFGRSTWHLLKPRLRRICPTIQHWTAEVRSYEEINPQTATWFVDPPYQNAGKHYTHSDVDFAHLGQWCQSLPGQAIVCEQAGATWLPFQPHKHSLGNTSSGQSGTKRRDLEMIWQSNPTQLPLAL